MRQITRRAVLLGGAALTLLLPSCQNGGHFTILGYSTVPNYRTDIHTIRVPIFQNRTFRQDMEFWLTQAVIREIESKTPYKVVSGNQPADTELTGTIISFTKGILNVNNANEQRDIETVLAVDFSWRDLRTGEALSKPPLRPGEILPPPPRLVTPDGLPGVVPPTVIETPTAPRGAFCAAPDVIRVTTTTHYIPELGQSLTTGMQDNVNRLAREIVHLMESPWDLPCPH